MIKYKLTLLLDNLFALCVCECVSLFLSFFFFHPFIHSFFIFLFFLSIFYFLHSLSYSFTLPFSFFLSFTFFLSLSPSLAFSLWVNTHKIVFINSYINIGNTFSAKEPCGPLMYETSVYAIGTYITFFFTKRRFGLASIMQWLCHQLMDW